jgi:hypothetical protein
MDNPWDTYTFRQWKHFATNLCLSAVQEALKTGDNTKTMQHLFAPDRSTQALGAHHNSKNNVQGMLLYHPLLLKSPWQAPDDLDKQIEELLAANEPALVARSISTSGTTTYDKDNAIKQLEVITASINLTLLRIYTLSSHSFHVLVRELIPRARFDQSSLFTHIKGARTEHLINLRAHHSKTRSTGAAALSREQLKQHSAAHTLKFIEDTYVEVDDDAPHYTWSDILTATRTPKMSVFAWVDSFTVRTLRYGDTVKKISAARSTKINKIISKQITDDEKSIIATLNTLYSALSLNAGQYTFTNLVKLLAQNVTSFTKRYIPSEHARISKYLRTRAMKYKGIIEMATQGSKGKAPPAKRQKVGGKGQRSWVYLEEATASRLVSPTPYSKGKGKGKSKGKRKDKGKVHLSPTYGKGKSKGKGKAKGKSKGKSKGKGNALQRPAAGNTLVPAGSTGSSSASLIKCHFCHIVGHIKPNCRKWLALSKDEQYQQRNTHETKYQLIYDHLEDSVLAPRYCQYCADTTCDGQNCESPFDPDDYNEASVFFTQELSHLVANAKLDRPLDSHAPQTEYMYHFDNDGWGEQDDYETGSQWDEQDEAYPEEHAYEVYPAEVESEVDAEDPEYEREDADDESGQNQAETPDEDDQDAYE